MRRNSMYRDLLRWAACFVVGAAFIAAGCSSDSSQKQAPDQSDEIQEPGALEPPADDDSQPSGQVQQPPSSSEPAPPTGGDQGMADDSVQSGPQPVSEQKLDSFVDTLQEVAQVEQQYRQRIAASEDQQEAQALQAEAQRKVQTKIAQGDLPQQEFMALLQRMQRDVELRKRVDSKLKEDS